MQRQARQQLLVDSRNLVRQRLNSWSMHRCIRLEKISKFKAISFRSQLEKSAVSLKVPLLLALILQISQLKVLHKKSAPSAAPYLFAAQAKYPSLKIVHQKKLAKMYIFYALHVIAKFIASLISSLYPSSKTSLTRKVFSGGYNERFGGYKFHYCTRRALSILRFSLSQ